MENDDSVINVVDKGEALEGEVDELFVSGDKDVDDFHGSAVEKEDD